MDNVRLDKWLWAARFFKSRSLAKQAIEGGKVHYDGARVKVSKEVLVGAELRIRQGWDEKLIEVIALSGQRRSASEAQLLYQETTQSIEQREARAAERKATGVQHPAGAGRPSKRNRRLIHRFKQDTD
jgi:ribosome-associated heat shock protein Hsp15